MVSGRVDEELLLRNEYLAAKNEILKSKLNKHLRLNIYERIRLAKIGKRIGLKALKEISCIVSPETFYDRIVGALSNLGYDVSDQTVGNILKKNGIPPVPNSSSLVPFNTYFLPFIT